jgi:hypothetical protein
MQEFGYVEASNFDIVYRYADGHVERLPPLAEEIVRLHPDVILAPASGPAVAAKKATSLEKQRRISKAAWAKVYIGVNTRPPL